MKKILLYYCMIITLVTTSMKETIASIITNKVPSDVQTLSFQSNHFQAPHTFFEYADNNGIAVPQEINKISKALMTRKK